MLPIFNNKPFVTNSKFCLKILFLLGFWHEQMRDSLASICFRDDCPLYLLFCTLLSCVQVWCSLHLQIQRLSGVDSDFAPFLHHAGVPSVDLYYGRGIVLPFLAKPDQTQNHPNSGISVHPRYIVPHIFFKWIYCSLADFPVYHTAFDSYNWMVNFGDPFFQRHVAGSYLF